MRRPWAVLPIALVLVLSTVRTVEAQPRAQIVVTTPTVTTPGSVSLLGVMADKNFAELMQHGFPLRMHMSAELWKAGGVLDQPIAKVQWEIIVKYVDFDHVYDVVRVTFDESPNGKATVTSLGTYKKLDAARIATELAFAPALPQAERGRKSYIAAQADVQTMEMSDLNEVEQWLRGETQPSGPPKRNAGKMFTRSIESLFTRLLGAKGRHIEGRSETFTL